MYEFFLFCLGVVIGMWLSHKNVLTYPEVATFCEKTTDACKDVVKPTKPESKDESHQN